MRKTFVLFCRFAVIQFTRKFFEDNFYVAYLALAQDRVPQVRMEFVRGLLEIKPFLDYNKQKSIELTERISELKGDKDDDVADASENTDLELMRTRKQMVKQFNDREEENLAREERLAAREVKDLEERKRQAEAEEENKFDFSSLLQEQKKSGKKGKLAKGRSGLTQPTKLVSGKALTPGTVPRILNEKTPTKRKNGV